MISNKYRIFVIQALLLLTTAVFAIDNATYYGNANGKKQKELKTALYQIIGNPSVKNYSSLWDWYYDTDRMIDNQVVDRYSNTKRYFTSRGAQPSGMNKEHGIPQSWWGGGTSGIGSDLQHVMPSESEANSRKSNYGMGIVTSQKWSNGSIKVGTGKAGNNGTVQLWEPEDKWKGDFARAYFYIVTAYEERSLVQAEGCNTMQSNTYPKLQPWAYELYMKWSREDPVDDLERTRNDVVYGIQGNRNPFIDFEGLEQYIWGDYMDVPFSVGNYENPYGNSLPTLKTPEASFAESIHAMEVGDNYLQTVQTNSDGAVTYISSNTQVASVNSESGLVVALAAGTTTITALVGATSTYRSVQVSYTINVTKPGIDPTPSDGNTYTKVTEKLNNWNGIYLIVCEADNVAMDGGLSVYDKTNNTIPVDIAGQNKIAVTETTTAAEFDIIKMDDGKYAIRGRGGMYMGARSKKNTVEASESPIAATIAVTNGEAIITTESGYSLRFNSQNGQKRFRFYSSGQESIALYRRGESGDELGPEPELETPTVAFDVDSYTIEEGETYTQLVTTNSDGSVTYSSSDPTVASVDASTGCVIGNAEGTAIIMADVAATEKYKAASASYTIVVYSKADPNPNLEIPYVTFDVAEHSLEVGRTYTQLLQTNSNGTVTYRSTVPTVAVVNAVTGLVKALSAGSTTIIANVSATNEYQTASASYTIQVVLPDDIIPLSIDEIRHKSGIYDLTGRSVRKIIRGGLYIIDGKKVVVK